MTAKPPAGPASDRTRVHRHPERGAYDRETIYSILDEGLVAHVGFVSETGPMVVPMGYGRDGDRLIFHGSPASRFFRTLASGIEVAATVTLLDGLVLARSAFHSSMNYRSVVVLGSPRQVTDPSEKARLLDVLVEHLIPGRTADARPTTAGEVLATTVLELSIDEASAKIRTGPPVDPPADVTWPTWAGILPLGLTAGPPSPVPDLAPGLGPPPYATHYRRSAK